MSKFYKFLSIIFLTIFDCLAMEPESSADAIKSINTEDIEACEQTDPQIEQQIQDRHKQIEELDREYEELMKQKALKDQRKHYRNLRRQQKLAASSNNTDLTRQIDRDQIINEQNNSFLQSITCERFCLTFIGIVAVLKILFNYYIDNENNENIAD